jgi:hypothetical protein
MTSNDQQSSAHTIEELSCRIARLAIALGVSLKTDAEVAHAINRCELVAEHELHGRNTDRHETSHIDSSADRRQTHLHEELRALLTMRYNIESHYVEEFGVIATRQLLIETETQLELEGFQQGAAGIDVDQLFNGN